MGFEEKYTVLARKYRPKNFYDIIGQDVIVSTLVNILKSGKIGNAYLFCGQRGVGKTTTARIFANAINCENISENGNPCFSCKMCLNYKNIFELDAASNNSVEDIRNIIDQVRYAPSFGKYNVYIIDEVHMLSQAAFNAFLKTLEEPPAHSVFILATTEKNKVIPTIMSRCQVFDFKPVTVSNIVKNLKRILDEEKISYDEEALFLIGEKSDGAIRDSLSFTDSILNFSPEYVSKEAVAKILNVVDHHIFFDLISCLIEKNIFDTLLQANAILNEGYDIMNFVNGLLKFFRNLLLAKDENTLCLLEYPQNISENFQIFSKKIQIENLIECISKINFWSLNYKDQINKKFYFEFLLFQLKKLLYSENICVKKSSITVLSEKKKDDKKTFDLKGLKKIEGFVYEKENINQKDTLLTILERELALTNV